MAALLCDESGTNSKSSSKLAAVLQRLHNANDVSCSSPLSDDKPYSPYLDERSPADSTITSNSASNNSTMADILSVGNEDAVKLEDTVSTKLEASEHARASRRKQRKTHKVLESLNVLSSAGLNDSNDQFVDADLFEYSTCSKSTDVAASQPCSVLPAEQTASKSTDDSSNNVPSSSGNGINDLVLPEGTVFVQPESVDSSPAFQELESSRTKSKFKGNLDTAIINCTACHRQIGSDSGTAVHRHPVLKVLICKKCYTLYTNTNIEQDTDGSDEQCRWCGQGGDLICCDFCHNAICKTCIRRNLGRKELSAILNAGDDETWRCYVCDPKPLLGLIDHCTAVMEALARQEKLESDKRRKLETSNKVSATGGSSNKVAISSTKPTSQTVSVIQTAAVSAIAKAKAQQTAKLATVGSIAPKTVAAILSHRSLAPNVALSPAIPRPASQMMQSAGQLKTPGVTEQNFHNVLERMLSATNSMNVFLQSLRLDARKTAAGNLPIHVDRRRELAAKMNRAFAAYTRAFHDAALRGSPRVGNTVQAARMPPTKGSAIVKRSNISNSTSSKPSIIRPTVPTVTQVSHSQGIPRPLANEVIELSDSDDDRGNGKPATSKPSSSSKQPSGQTIAATSSKQSEPRTNFNTKSVANTKKRVRPSEDAGNASSLDSSAKRLCSDDSVTPQTAVVEDGVMFDGGVDEIPTNDGCESSDDHHLQLYCVEVDEDSDDSDSVPVTSTAIATKRVNGPGMVPNDHSKPRSLLEVELTSRVVSRQSQVS